MKLKFLGTAAAEAIPALWCECPVCRRAKELGGRELRRRCSYLIDRDTLIDFGPDAYWQVTEFGIDLTAVDRILFTHPHEDHLATAELSWRRTPYFSHVEHWIDVCGTRMLFGTILGELACSGMALNFEELRIRPVEVQPGVWAKSGDVELLPMRANHAPGKDPVFYLIRRGGRTVLIANDTGWPPEESWSCLAKEKIDLAVLESTMGPGMPDCRNGHMGADVTVAFRKRLIELGSIRENTPVYANHFSHNCKANHEELVALFRPHGIEVAYDGLSVEV